MVKVIIEMDGGVLQNVSANVPIEYVLVDYDVNFRTDVNEEDLNEEERLENEDAKFGFYISTPTAAIIVNKDLPAIFIPADPMCKRIHERLRTYNF